MAISKRQDGSRLFTNVSSPSPELTVGDLLAFVVQTESHTYKLHIKKAILRHAPGVEILDEWMSASWGYSADAINKNHRSHYDGYHARQSSLAECVMSAAFINSLNADKPSSTNPQFIA